MPHLSPTSWSAALLSFWLVLLFLNALIWWMQLPKFPQLNVQTSPPTSNPWTWK